MLNKMFELNQTCSSLGIISCFVGPFTQDLIAEMGSSLRESLVEEGNSSSLAVKIFAVVVELSQNILHYSSERGEAGSAQSGSRIGVLVVGKKDDSYFVLSGNLVPNEKKQKLTEYLGYLNSLDKKELRKLYSERRRRGPDSDSKGAGLGFIEMARKASQPLDFDCHDVDDRNSFFSIKIRV